MYSPIDILLISNEIKHWETYIYICCDTFYRIIPYIGFYNKHPLCYIGFHTHEQQFTSAERNSRNWTVLKSCQRASMHLYLMLRNRTYSKHMTRNETHTANQLAASVGSTLNSICCPSIPLTQKKISQ